MRPDPDALRVTPAGGFMAEHAHYDDDAGFWEALADRLGSPIVDLGAAAGRLAVPIAARGHEVWAVDNDLAMLDVLTARAAAEGLVDRIHTTQGDLSAPPLPEGVGLVMIAMNTLQVLTDPEAQVACLSAVARCLRPDGEVVFDLTVPSFADIEDALGDVRRTAVQHDPLSGDMLVHSAVYDELDPVTQTLRFRIIVERRGADGAGGREEREHVVHLFTPTEVVHLVARAGLRIIDRFGSFRGEPLTGDSERQVYRCAPAGVGR